MSKSKISSKFSSLTFKGFIHKARLFDFFHAKCIIITGQIKSEIIVQVSASYIIADFGSNLNHLKQLVKTKVKNAANFDSLEISQLTQG